MVMSGARRFSMTEEWRLGWKLVLAASFGFSFFSVMLAGAGLFMEPVMKEFGWTKTEFSFGISIATITTALLSTPFGILVDRFGSRRVALPGIILTFLSCAAFSLANGSQWQWWGLWLAFGVVAVSIKSTVWTAAVLGVFSRDKGMALGLTLAGTAVAALLVPNIGNALIENFGWRAAYFWLALGWGSITLLMCWLFFYDVHDRAAATRKQQGTATAAPETLNLPGLSVPQAYRDWALWRVAISNFVVMLLTMGLSIHMFPILTEAGISRGNAALLTSLGGIAGIVGKLLTGWLLDRYRPNWIGGITLGAASLTFALLIVGLQSPVLIVIAILVNGYAGGTKTQITGFLTAGYGGMKNFGVIYGFMAALMALASGLGPLFGGLAYDYAGGYEPFLIAGTIGCALGGLLIVSMPRYPVWEKRGEAKAEAEVFG